jgi:murein DD-endopeptidase MepM/ murein hydrolase activator NlpD
VNRFTADRPVRHAARKRVAVVLAIATAAPVIGAGAAAAQVGPGGGTTAPGDPQVLSIQCLTKCIGPSTGVIKSKIRLLGNDLGNTTMVSLPRADGTRAKDKSPVVKPSGSVLAMVRKGAVTGPVRTADSFGQVKDSSVSFTVGTKAQLKAVQAQYRFPVAGPHTYGDGFGAPRSGHSHQGIDIFAKCGTPLVVAHTGVVKANAFQGSAGNYVVIDGAGVKQDYFYAHMKKPSALKKGMHVTTGQVVGNVGESGNASGCHLHFEIWAGAGWYSGGKPVDPEKTVRYWDSFS